MHRRQHATIPGPVLGLVHYLCSLFSDSYWALEMVIQRPIYCWASSSHILSESLVLQFLSEKNEGAISVPGLSELEVRFLLHEDLLGTDCGSGAEASSVDSIMRKMLLQSYRKCLQDRQLEWSDLPLPWVHPRCIINVMCCAFLRTLGHRCRCCLFSVRKTNESQVMCPRSVTLLGFNLDFPGLKKIA